MRVVFLGAGASYGSEPTARVPPLGDKLLEELTLFAPRTWGTLPPEWASKFRTDFEVAMAAFINPVALVHHYSGIWPSTSLRSLQPRDLAYTLFSSVTLPEILASICL